MRGMPSGAAAITYVIAEPFETAVKALRRALTGGGLRISGEVNMSGRLRRRLMIGTAPCLILFVSRMEAPEAGAAPLTPLHIVASARGRETEIHVMRVWPEEGEPPSEAAIVALGAVLAEVGRAIEKIGMRAALGA